MTYEIECPVCDRMAPSSAHVCAHCGADLNSADLNMASFDDLEMVAEALATGKQSALRSEPKPQTPSPEPQTPSPEPMVEAAPIKPSVKEDLEQPKLEMKPQQGQLSSVAEESIASEKAKEEKKDDEGKRGLGRLFGKKKK
jgi:hypothetical protein